MTRVLIQYTLPLVLPFVLYVAYLYFGRRRRGGEGPLLVLDQVPWLPLLGAGVLLVAVTVGLLAWIGGVSPDMEYVPPRVINGRIVPGHFK